MDTKSESRNQYTMLSVQFGNELSCNTDRDSGLFDMFGQFFFADEHSFLQRCQFLEIADDW